jgi:hypothetical protein
MKKIVLTLVASASLYAHPTIELVSIYPGTAESLKEGLAKYNFEGTIIPSDLNHYEELKKDRSLWSRLLKKCGIRLSKQVPLKEGISKIVFFNIDVHYRRDFVLKQLPKEKMVLFMWEPPIALRKMYGESVKQCFSKIYTWDDSLVDNQTYFKFYYPCLQPMREDIPSFEEKKLCTLVSGNAPNKRPNCLYDERKKAIEFFEAIGEAGFEFYGRNWDPQKYKSYRGTVGDKIGAIKNYRFSICYENTCNIEGYITEKIFDCFAAGNVPIYWGASNIEKYIPKNCFIDRREFPSLEELYAYIKNMPKEEYEAYLDNIRAYLNSDAAKLFSLETFAKIFSEAVSG